MLRVRNDLFPEFEIRSTILPSMLDLSLLKPSRKHDNLILGTPQQTMSPISNGSDDGYNMQLNQFMDECENNWSEDGNDEEMNRHINAYEG